MWGNIDDEFGASTSEHNNAVISTLSKQNLNIGWFFGAISTLQISTNISFELVFKVGGTYLFNHITRIRCFGLKKLIWWSIKSRTLSYDMSTMDLMMNSNQWKHKNCIRITWFCVFFNFSCMSIIFFWCSHCFTFTCFSCILQ